MKTTLKRWWRDISEGLLLLRVILFVLALVLAAVPSAAFLSGVAQEAGDGSLYILLAVLTAIACFLFYASVWGNDRFILRVDSAMPGDLEVILAIATFAIPITIVIKRTRAKFGRETT